jgi:hypothetical protein
VQGDTHSFIVRIWREAVDSVGQRIIWRGSVEHVGTGKRVYFHDDLGSIIKFIQEAAGVRTRPVIPKWWQSVLAWVKYMFRRLARIWGTPQ